MSGEPQSTFEEHASGEPALRPRRFAAPSEQAEHDRRRHRMVMLLLRTFFLVLLVTVSLLPFVGTLSETEEFSFWDYAVPFLATFAFGAVIVLVDAATPNKRLSAVFGIYLGLIAGLIAAVAAGYLIDLVGKSWDLSRDKTWISYLGLAKIAIAITLCYIAVSVVITTKDDFRLVIPYVEFAKQIRGVRPLLIDTSVLIDGRIDGLAQTGFLDAPLIVPQFVVEELQTLADSGDKLKRARGRRGLNTVSKLQASANVDISIDNADLPRKSVDHMLLDMAKEQSLRILTTDYNLNKVAQIHGVTVLNLNDLTNTLKSQAIPGETLVVDVIKPGEGAGQGVGYMPDGTMVVIEDAAAHIGKSVSLIVTNSLQTTAGRMIFGTLRDVANGEQMSHTEAMAKAATTQPRTPVRTVKVDGGNGGAAGATSSAPSTQSPVESRRNPRR